MFDRRSLPSSWSARLAKEACLSSTLSGSAYTIRSGNSWNMPRVALPAVFCRCPHANRSPITIRGHGKVAARGMAVTDSQRRQFEHDGYLVIEEPLAAEGLLDSIVDGLGDLYGDSLHKRDGVVFYPNRIQDAWKID